MRPPVYIISLKHRKDRRDALLPQLKKYGIEPVWFEAINGHDLPFTYPFDFKEKHKGLIGCHASHLQVWRQAKGDVIIMEDDCQLQGDIFEDYEKVKNRTEPIHLFGYSKYASKKYTRTDIEGIIIPEKPLTTHCYLFRPKYAKALVKEAAKFERIIDVLTSECGGTASMPMKAIQAPGKSDITGGYTDYRRVMQ